MVNPQVPSEPPWLTVGAPRRLHGNLAWGTSLKADAHSQDLSLPLLLLASWFNEVRSQHSLKGGRRSSNATGIVGAGGSQVGGDSVGV